MSSIKIINSIKLDSKGVRVKDANGKYILLHKRQGDMDGACAVYSLAMAMLCIGVITNEDLQVYANPDRRTCKGKFLSHFLEEQGLVRRGYSFISMAREIRESSFNLDAIRKNPKEDDNIINAIVDVIDKESPVIISTDFKEGAHALLAVGYEITDDSDKITKILCLDSGEEAPKYSCWNCIIDVSHKNEKSEYPYVCITRTQAYRVTLGDILMIKKAE